MLQRYFLSALLLITPFLSSAQSVEFVRNDGQWDGPFQYKATTGNSDVFFSENSFTYLISHPSNPDRMEAVKHGHVKGPAKLDYHAYRMYFEGAGKPIITGSKEQSWYYNYFLGKDNRKWKSGIHPALAMDYKGLYDGIDMHIASEKGNVKYEFMVGAGKNPDVIKLRYDGEDGISIKNGNLIIKTSVGDVQELKPYAYQYTESGRTEVACRYHLKGNTVTYDLYNGYDETKLLVIDPTLVFSTFTGSTADNWGYTATYDAAGNFYGGGAVFANGFPAGTGAFQLTFAGGFNDPNLQTGDDHGLGVACDIGVIKYNPTGTTKIYATYIGGTDNEVPHSMVVDANNELIITGKTNSSDYPTTSASYDASYNGSGDILLTKFNSTATGLVGSTFMGGTGKDGTNFSGSEYVYGNLKYNYGDDARSEIIVDNAGNVYMAGSSSSTNFPMVNAQQATKGGGQDAVIFKMSPTLSTLIWSTYLGGTADDAGYVLALNTAQTKLYVGGGTMSSNLATATPGTWHTTYQGGTTDGYIVRFLNSGTYPLEKVCYIGTSNQDQVYGVQVDASDNVYAMGQSLGGAFPVTAGVYSNPNSSQFVMKLNPDLATNLFSTVYGSGNSAQTNISPVAFLVDTCGNIYISGWGGNLSIPNISTTIGTTTGMATTANANQSTTDGFDFYFIVFGRNANSLLYATFYGRNSNIAAFGEHVDGGTSRFDKAGVVYQAICGGCGGTAGPPLPTTPGSYSPINGSTNCNLASLKIAFELGAVDAGAQAAPTTRGCPPLTVQFSNNSTNAVNYLWDFRDATATSSLPTPQHTFTTPGVYNVRLIASNPNACKTADTAYVTITVDNNSVTSDFNYAILDSCGPYRVSFVNSSVYGGTPGSASFTKFTWLFGDNTSFTGTTPPIHSYSGPGTYTVTLVMKDSTACNSPDTVQKTFSINGINVKADFSLEDSLCVGSGISFTNSSTNATGIKWAFGDGETDTTRNTIHTYEIAGTYTVTLIATNPNSCNKIDSITKSVTVSGRPHADFTFTPVIPVPNTPISFTNASTGAISYEWAFGDGNRSTDVNPSHLYRRSGQYTVCLVAKNKEGCTDTVCKGVEADVQTGIDLPTAFSPNGDGNNDRFFPRGGGIETMDFKIFNRWGQLVFEAINAPANDPAYGWDGTYKGKEQEMEVYAFVLNVTYIDGTTAQRKGNVTLLR